MVCRQGNLCAGTVVDEVPGEVVDIAGIDTVVGDDTVVVVAA
jgi:hypothetical protein